MPPDRQWHACQADMMNRDWHTGQADTICLPKETDSGVQACQTRGRSGMPARQLACLPRKQIVVCRPWHACQTKKQIWHACQAVGMLAKQIPACLVNRYWHACQADTSIKAARARLANITGLLAMVSKLYTWTCKHNYSGRHAKE